MTTQQFIDQVCLGIVTQRHGLTMALADSDTDPVESYRKARQHMRELEERRSALAALEGEG